MKDLTEELSILLSKYKVALICRSANDNDSSVEIGIQDCKANNLWLGRHHLTGYDLLGNLPITLKPFDISEHEFSDYNITPEGVVNDCVDLSVAYDQWGGHMNGYSEEEKAIKINKQDAIAIAKALGVTGDDL